ncbi:MAG: hypothetical protein LBG45_02515 [Dysgonamonadaceae bacterium]|nr:hypothetical protein [Dysgonamonadaceae bacterium]
MERMENMDFQDKVFLFDRGYPDFRLLYLLTQKDVKFVMRVKQSAPRTVKRFMESVEKESIVRWYPGYRSIKKLREKGIEVNGKTGIALRMVKAVLNTGEVEVLVTSLFDSQVYTCQDLKEVYGLWRGIETGSGYLKEELQPAQFSGIRQIRIEQDFAAILLLYSLQSLIEKQSEPCLEAANRRRKHKYKVNKNISWGMLKYRVVRLFLETDSRDILTELENLFKKHLETVRPGRKYQRKKNGDCPVANSIR